MVNYLFPSFWTPCILQTVFVWQSWILWACSPMWGVSLLLCTLPQSQLNLVSIDRSWFKSLNSCQFSPFSPLNRWSSRHWHLCSNCHNSSIVSPLRHSHYLFHPQDEIFSLRNTIWNYSVLNRGYLFTDKSVLTSLTFEMEY